MSSDSVVQKALPLPGSLAYSEAIILGGALGPQAFEQLYDGESACANGAALLAIGADPARLARRGGYGCIPIYRRWPWTRVTAEYPVKDCTFDHRTVETYKIPKLVVHLNDGHRWTLTAIARFVRLLEERFKVGIDGKLPKRRQAAVSHCVPDSRDHRALSESLDPQRQDGPISKGQIDSVLRESIFESKLHEG